VVRFGGSGRSAARSVSIGLPPRVAPADHLIDELPAGVEVIRERQAEVVKPQTARPQS
jgi:hypothetical protein